MGRRPKIQQEQMKPIKLPKFKTPSLIRGMRDILPIEQNYWNFIKAKVQDCARKYGYSRIDIPILEEKNLFLRTIGKQTDLVTKEMFCFSDPSGNNVCLRPEGTASIVRAYIRHGMQSLPQPVKLYYMGSMFRYERPQSGRQREFHQFGFEILGDASPISDVQMILILHHFFNELSIKTTLQINSIGCPMCRESYKQELIKFLKTKKSRLCKDCRKRLGRNPLRVLDCKEKGCQFIKEEGPQNIDWLCEPCKTHFVKVLEYLDDLEISYELNSYLVRGLDYYNRTVFELWPVEDNNANSQNSLGGGGRYDDLITILGGKPTPACGFAVGMERVILQMKKLNLNIPQPESPVVFIAQLGEQAKRKCLKLFESLHKENIFAAEAFSKDSLKTQLEMANKLKVKFTLILGQKEVIDKTILLRDMEGGMQEIIDFKKIIPELKKKLEELCPKSI